MNPVFICAFTFHKVTVTAEVPASVKMVPPEVVITLWPGRTHSREVVCDLALAPSTVTGDHHSRDTSHRSSTVPEPTLFFRELRSFTTSVFCSPHLTVLTNAGLFRGALCPRQGCGVQVALAPLAVKWHCGDIILNPIQTVARTSVERPQTNITLTLGPEGSDAVFLFAIMYRFFFYLLQNKDPAWCMGREEDFLSPEKQKKISPLLPLFRSTCVSCIQSFNPQ